MKTRYLHIEFRGKTKTFKIQEKKPFQTFMDEVNNKFGNTQSVDWTYKNEKIEKEVEFDEDIWEYLFDDKDWEALSKDGENLCLSGEIQGTDTVSDTVHAVIGDKNEVKNRQYSVSVANMTITCQGEGCDSIVQNPDILCGNCDKLEMEKCLQCSVYVRQSQRICMNCSYKVNTSSDDGDDLDGGHDHRQKYSMTTLIQTETDVPVKHKEKEIATVSQQVKGLVVVCYHSEYKIRSHPNIPPRKRARTDATLMHEIWKKYGFKVKRRENEESTFYDKDLIKLIEDEFKKRDMAYFVLVLSTHGEERQEVVIGEETKIQHYFFTKDGQYNTQQLINNIADVKELDGKIKVFIIQACRSRHGYTRSENEDHGYGLAIELIKQDLVEQTNGQNSSDAKGFMPPDLDTDETSLLSKATESRNQQIDPQITDKTEEQILPIESVPHCEDCVVFFATMAGKYAYKTANTDLEGGWLIRALYETMKKKLPNGRTNLLDLFTEVNREVGQRESEEKRTASDLELHDSLKEDIIREMIISYATDKTNQVNEVINSNVYKNENLRSYSSELEIMINRANTDNQTKESLLILHQEELIPLTKKIATEIDIVTLKSQSCFLHNLACMDDDIIL